MGLKCTCLGLKKSIIEDSEVNLITKALRHFKSEPVLSLDISKSVWIIGSM